MAQWGTMWKGAPILRLCPYSRILLILVSALFIARSIEARETTKFPERTIRIPGVESTVEILIDRWGVSHIYAKSQDDRFFAQGFNAARDRLFQIDLWRRRGLGMLSEVFGPSYVDQDQAARLFLYRGDMHREWLAYASDAKRIATAFVAGINSYIDYLKQNPDRMPFEYKYLGYSPAKWRPEDVVRIRSHGLTRNLTSEVARASLACKTTLKDDEIRIRLQPPWELHVPEGLDPCLPDDLLKVFRLATQEVHVASNLRPSENNALLDTTDENNGEILEGSNNWVIAPNRSATGRPILANDPHRAYATPSLRYIVHLYAPGLNVIGAGEPALPGISIGHNGRIAFGLTIFAIDQEDLYVYQLNPDNPEEYRYQERWEPFRVVREQIAVKGATVVPIDLRFTRHGPVIFIEKEKQRVFAVRSAWMEPGMSPYFGSSAYMRAQNWEQFLAAMNRWAAPTENLVYADVDGNIGWAPGGLAPIRPNWDGLLPVSGEGRYEWAGFWDRDQLPSILNPKEGWFTTSNQLNLPANYPYQERKLGFEWTNESRHLRISEVLASKSKTSIRDSMDLQNDFLSIPARRLNRLLQSLDFSNTKARAAQGLLKGWDNLERAESPEAALIEVWSSKYLSQAFKKAILSQGAADRIGTPDMAVMLELLENPDGRFGSDPVAKRNELLITSLAEAYVEMEKLQGADPKQWQWGKLHHNLAEHPLARGVDEPMAKRLNFGPVPTGGSAYTPNQSAYRISDFLQTSGPSFRIIIDVGGWDNSQAINMPGQSGDPDDKHYRDLGGLWLKGQYFPLCYTRKAVEEVTEERIQIVPDR
jgi:penicillin amidase